ncbi:phosphoglucomutase/phosphomannomutase family protein [Erysipelothrix sp. HDW6A]|uniref:phosphoglucomutase/phosphomannomutase family protein n=1 Tax=Erysipelothrix sp. HDW6A TaxID=2714928 RepID=UPI00140C5390|nr:phosphoglucomutase/phosphomannomutase family protein [Erysipelothrix sp. HDW6A]QIK57072.1 phosphoglucomutase/phosphomannomutase family protein [Erysipelothrix sp. HDW6A]
MIKFGTGGFRAIIGDEFTKNNITKIANGLVKIIQEDDLKKDVIIGYDRRFLSKEAALWVSKVLTDAKIKVKFINKSTPTPMIMYGVATENIDLGVAITASHNPALYNGIKLFKTGGVDADVKFTDRVEKLANKAIETKFDADDFHSIVSSEYFKYYDISDDYVDAIASQIQTNQIANSNIRVGLDPIYGVSEKSLRKLFKMASCEVLVINEIHDTLFGGKIPTPTLANLEQLKEFVCKNSLDIGIATDGDADRIGVIDDKGNMLHPNEILMLIYYYLLEYRKETGPIVRNISTTHILDKIAHDFEQEVYEVPVGFKNISQKMVEVDALIGGESSGGLTIRGHINGKDGIYAAMVLVEMIAVTGKSISTLYREVVDRYGSTKIIEKEYRFSFEQKRLFLEKTKQNMISLQGFETIILHDGIKLIDKNNWILVRLSGTEPLLRIVAEIPEKGDIDEKLIVLLDQLDLREGEGNEINS